MKEPNVDALARELARWGRMAARLPPSGRLGDAVPIACARTGRILGRVVPGVGVDLPIDLRALGISRRIPLVRGRSAAMRAIDALLSRRGAFTDLATLRAAPEQQSPFMIPGTGGGTAVGQWVAGCEEFARTTQDNPPKDSLNGRATPGYTAAPGTAPDNTNACSLGSWITNPAGSNTKYLTGFSWLADASGAQAMGLLADLLVECKVDATIATVQTLNTTALTRYTGAVGVHANLFSNGDGTVAFAAGQATITVVYKNPGGVSHTTTYSGAGNTSGGVIDDYANDGGDLPCMRLVSGDTGVKQIVSVQISSASAAGWLGAHLYKPLVYAPGHPALNHLHEMDTTTGLDALTPLVTTAGGALGCFVLYVEDGGSGVNTLRGSIVAREG